MNYLEAAMNLVSLSNDLPEQVRAKLSSWLVDSIVHHSCPSDWGIAPDCKELYNWDEPQKSFKGCLWCWTKAQKEVQE